MRTLLAAMLALLLAGPGRAAEIAVDLADDVIEVGAGFAGAKVVLFGALTGDAAPDEEGGDFDLVAVVRGPATTYLVRPMIRDGMIWSTGPGVYVRGAPSVFLTHSTRPLDDVVDEEGRRAYQLDADALDLDSLLQPSSEEAAALLAARGSENYANALHMQARRAGLFESFNGAVVFRKGALFSIEVRLPPTTPVGRYHVDAYLFRAGELLSHDSTRLDVTTVGIERTVYELAHTRPIAYGISCVLIALSAGWAAAAAFRRRS